jgi:hypothetical protein
MDELKKMFEENKKIIKTTAVAAIVIAAVIWGQAPEVPNV